MSTLRLGILDFCFRAPGQSAGERLHEAIDQAEAADRLGYDRYWLSEHHGPDAAQACPELLVPLILARTRRLRAGPAGILLSHYSPFKVADTFRCLEALFPGRVDLGVGRGGTDPATAAALLDDVRAEPDYERKVIDLVGHLSGALPPEHPHSGAQACPVQASSPEVWVLASGGPSTALAARVGACCSVGLFLRHAARQADPSHLRQYREQCRAEIGRLAPRTNIALAGICAESAEQAQAVLRTHDNPFI